MLAPTRLPGRGAAFVLGYAWNTSETSAVASGAELGPIRVLDAGHVRERAFSDTGTRWTSRYAVRAEVMTGFLVAWVGEKGSLALRPMAGPRDGLVSGGLLCLEDVVGRAADLVAKVFL